jgi:hypothetical protein
MGKRILLVVFLLSFFALFVFAGGALAAKKPSASPHKASVVYPTVDGGEALPSFGATPVIYEGGKAADCYAINPDPGVVVIQQDQWGATWYDYQKNGSMGRMIAVTSAGQKEMAFTNLVTPPYITGHPRWVTYNCKNASNVWCGTKDVDGGTNINAGYVNSCAMHDGREAMIYHKAGSLATWYTTLAIGDSGYVCSGSNAFVCKYDVPDSLGGAVTNNGMWPKMGIVYDEVTGRDYMHIVMTEGKTSGGNQKIGYVRCYLMPDANPATCDTLICEMPTTQSGPVSPVKIPANKKMPNLWAAYFGQVPTLPAGEYTNTISVVVATSPVSKKVRLVWTNKREAGTNQYNNDVCYVASDSNGNEWFRPGNWPPSIANGLLHYVTNYATTDMERAYTDVAACFDYNDNLHVVWSSCYYDSVGGLVGNDVNLMHWSEATGNISLVAPGYWGGTNPGGWNNNISKMSISAKDPIYHPGGDPDSVYLFCTWTQFNGENMDSLDNSLAGFTNGEIYAAVSSDGGQSWTPGFNLTGTRTNNCDSSDCLSEHWSSLAENMYGGDLHLEYVCDKDAGGIVQAEGAWTLDPMMYMHIQQLPATVACGQTFLNQDPPSWETPPLKVPPTGSRTIGFTLKGIYNKAGSYEVIPAAGGPVTCISNCSKTVNPGEEWPVGLRIDCTGESFIETEITIKTCKNTVDEDSIKLPLFAVCSNDYYECTRDPATQLEKTNGVCSLWVCANSQEKLWDLRLPKDSNQVLFTAGTFVATITPEGQTVVGRQDYRDTRTGAKDTIRVVQGKDYYEPECIVQKVHVENTYIWYPPTIPEPPKWYWIDIYKQIIMYHDNPPSVCPEWKKEQIIKYIWIKWSRRPVWWPTQTYTGHGNIYYGVYADIDAPFDTGCRVQGGETQSGCNEAGWDNGNKIIWQSGFGGLNHPEYANHYVGLALTNTSGAIVTPVGCKDIRNSEYLYPNNGWGWQDSQFYRLAATPLNPATVVDNPDSVVDRSAVLTAGMIPAGGAADSTFLGEFILIEASLPNASEGAVADHMSDTRTILIPELAAQGLFSKSFPKCGDVNADGKYDSADIVYLINYLYLEAPSPPWPLNRANVNNDNKIDAADVVYLINYLYTSGPKPVCKGFGR